MSLRRASIHAVLGLLILLAACRRHGEEGPEGVASEGRLELQRLENGTVATTTFLAMDTVYTVSLGVKGPWDAAAKSRVLSAFAAAEAAVRRVEGLMSSHTATGDVHRLNASHREWVPLDRATLEVLLAAVRVGHASGGAFDLTWTALRPLYRLKDPAWRPPAREKIRQALALVDFRALELDVQGSRAR